MAQLVKEWSGPNQTAFASAVDQAAQYRQAGLAIIDGLRAVGWTVERSSNGTTASAADNIATTADIVFGTEASQAHSWACMVPPTGKGSPPGGSAFRLQINFNNSNADTTPQSFDLYLARGTYVGGANGTTTTRPSIFAGGLELSVLTRDLIPWTAALAGSFCWWTTTDGDLYFGCKANGDAFFRSLFFLRDDPNNGIGDYTLTLYGFVSATVNVVTLANLQTPANHRAFLADGSAAVSATLANCTAFALTNWTSGQEATTNRIPLRDVEIQNNASTSGARDFGVLVDVLGGPTNTGFNLEDNEDDGESLPFVFRTIGVLALPCDTAIT